MINKISFNHSFINIAHFFLVKKKKDALNVYIYFFLYKYVYSMCVCVSLTVVYDSLRLHGL